MKKFLTILCMLLMAISMNFVIAWGYQVFWNNLVLNIWQMFTTVDVVNTMQIPYWAFFAIAISIGLVYNPPAKESESTDNIAEAFTMIISKAATKLITIGIALLVTSLVF
jgi:uncharacterized membrane protein